MKLLGTDSRLRNDIRILENGDQESAEKEKAIVEANQRGTCKHFIRTTDADTGEEYHEIIKS
jgi:hypothetical protein